MNGEVPNIKKWVVFYPVYINSKKTVAEGRRISLTKACENPTCVEIADCCGHLKLANAIEVCSCMICDVTNLIPFLFLFHCGNSGKNKIKSNMNFLCLIRNLRFQVTYKYFPQW